MRRLGSEPLVWKEWMPVDWEEAPVVRRQMNHVGTRVSGVEWSGERRGRGPSRTWNRCVGDERKEGGKMRKTSNMGIKKGWKGSRSP